MMISGSRRVMAVGALVLASSFVASVAFAPTAFGQTKSAPKKTATQKVADISGDWIVTGTAPTDTLKSTAVFQQTGAAVTGTFAIPLIGSGKLSGTIKGDSVAFVIPFVLQAKPVEVK
ncbi:MAG: hypothetical protein ABI120_14095, partial [Gemmatimonadaceae bacterium]